MAVSVWKDKILCRQSLSGQHYAYGIVNLN